MQRPPSRSQDLSAPCAAAKDHQLVRAGTEGNPLFLEERLSSLLGSAALVRDQDGWQLDQGVAAAMPEALERLVRSRVDRLGPAARDTLVAASVLGVEFSLPELAAVSPVEVGLPEALSELCSGGLLTEVAQQARPAYRFRHALIQEATYRGIVKAERRRLHARVAWALEEASADRLDEVAGVLGHHYAAAGETERAVHYLELAGDQAASVFANEEAISCYRSALAAIGPGRPEGEPLSSAAVELRAKLGELCGSLSRATSRPERCLQEAIGLTGPADSFQAARLHYLLGRVEITNQRYDAALAALAAAERLLGDHPEDQGPSERRLVARPPARRSRRGPFAARRPRRSGRRAGGGAADDRGPRKASPKAGLLPIPGGPGVPRATRAHRWRGTVQRPGGAGGGARRRRRVLHRLPAQQPWPLLAAQRGPGGGRGETDRRLGHRRAHRRGGPAGELPGVPQRRPACAVTTERQWPHGHPEP